MAWDVVFKKGREITKVEDFVKSFYEKYKFELRNSKILDLGCRTGRHTIFFAKKGLEVYTLDKSKLAINILKKRIKKKHKIKIIESDIKERFSAKNYKKFKHWDIITCYAK